MPRLAVILILAATAGCAEDESVPTGPQPPPPVAGCAEHEVGLPDGSCFRPGIPPDGCADGFTHDGVYGCVPVLPAEPCAPGTMALPGEDRCRAVMDCGDGKWGQLPVDAFTVHVDGAYTGGDGDGSAAKPWATITQAVSTAARGAFIAVAAGRYDENVVLDRQLRLWGVCPELVTIRASSTPVDPCPPAALCLVPFADGSEIGGVAIEGAGTGIVMTGVTDVRFDRVHVHHNAIRGVSSGSMWGATSLHVVNSLIEQNDDVGVYIGDTDAVIETSVVRGTVGTGVTIEAPCVPSGAGFTCSPSPVTTTLRGLVVESSEGTGVLISGSEVDIDASVVRTTRPLAGQDYDGKGVAIQLPCDDTSCDIMTRSNVRVSRTVVDANHHAGVAISGSDVIIDASVVRATVRSNEQRASGYGIHAGLTCLEGPDRAVCDIATRSTTSITHSLVEQNADLGVFVTGSDVSLAETVVRATIPRVTGRGFGLGVGVFASCGLVAGERVCDPGARANTSMHHVLIADSHDMGLLVTGSDASVDASVVRATAASPTDGFFGDGIAAAAEQNIDAWVAVSGTFVDDHARAGVASFGAGVTLSDSFMRCSEVALTGQPYLGKEVALDDGGGNLCGCGDEVGPCKLVAAGLDPPTAPATE